jgi:hypothetical protein
MHRIVLCSSNFRHIRSIRNTSIAHDLELTTTQIGRGFEYDSAALTALEEAFLRHSGELLGAFGSVGAENQEALRIDWHAADLGVEHVYIKPRTAQLDGKLERSHRTDNDEFFSPLTYRDQV